MDPSPINTYMQNLNALCETLFSLEKANENAELNWDETKSAYIFGPHSWTANPIESFHEDLGYIAFLFKTNIEKLGAIANEIDGEFLKIEYKVKTAAYRCSPSVESYRSAAATFCFQPIFQCIEQVKHQLKGMQEMQDRSKAENPLTCVPARPSLASPMRPLDMTPAQRLVSNAGGYKQQLSLCDILPNHGLVIHADLIIDAIFDLELQQNVDKKAIKDANNAIRPFAHCGALLVPQSTRVWTSMAICQTTNSDDLAAKQIEVRNHQTTPTSLRNDVHPEENDLANFKVQIDERNDRVCITCGAIDTQKKADEFIAGVFETLKLRKALVGPLPTFSRLRIALHQVNSHWTDGKLIPKQHNISRYIENRLRDLLTAEKAAEMGLHPLQDMPIVAHTNNSLNRATLLPREDSVSNFLNLDAWAAKALWMIEDVEGEGPLPQQMESAYRNLLLATKELRELRAEISTIKDRIESDSTGICARQSSENLSSKLLERQQMLIAQLKEIVLACNQLQTAIQAIEKPMPAHLMLHNQTRVLALLIAKQTYFLQAQEVPAFSRNQELELALISDMLLGCVTEINCKSGLDRTGLMRSLLDALKTMKEQFALQLEKSGVKTGEIAAKSYEKVIELILQQDKLTQELDDLQVSLMPSFKECIATQLENMSQTKACGEPFRQKLIEIIRSKYDSDQGHMAALLNALTYQDLVCANLLRIAQPITLDSTGVIGLKYGHSKNSVTGNPHPLKRLPMFICTSEGKMIQLYHMQYTLLGCETSFLSKGALKHFFTPAGLHLLERLSQKRGS